MGQVSEGEGPEKRDEAENNCIQRRKDSEPRLFFVCRVSAEPEHRYFHMLSSHMKN